MRPITLADAARIHEVSERTLRRWIAAGELKSVKRGRTVWVHPQAVGELVARKASTNTRRARPQSWHLT